MKVSSNTGKKQFKNILLSRSTSFCHILQLIKSMPHIDLTNVSYEFESHKFISKPSVILEIGQVHAARDSNPGNKAKNKAHGRSKIERKMNKDYSHSNSYPFNSSIKGKCTGLKQHLFEHFSCDQWVCLHLGYFSRENNYVLPSLKTILSGFDSWNLFCLFYGNRHILAAPTLLLLELLWQEKKCILPCTLLEEQPGKKMISNRYKQNRETDF